MSRSKQNISKIILDHPDREEIISKLLMNISCNDIAEWLSAKYSDVNEQKFILSEKTLSKFQDEYLDIYTQIKDDLEKTKSPDIQLRDEIVGTTAYHKALEKYIDDEIDIRSIVRKMVINAQERIAQMYDIVQEDPRNFKVDRTLLEWFSTLADILSKYDTILNPPNLNQDQVNIQNNINIQVLDSHMNIIYEIIRDILTKLDYDTSLIFIDMFNLRMQELKSTEQQILPIENRLEIAQKLEETVEKKLIQ